MKMHHYLESTTCEDSMLPDSLQVIDSRCRNSSSRHTPRRLNVASSIPWPEVVASRWRISLRIVTQDITIIQVRMVPVLAKGPCDVLTVARSWDDLPVQAHLSAGCRGGLKSVGCHSCSGLSSCGMSAASRACGMTGRVALVWDVSRVQHELSEGCHEHIRIGG